MRRFPEIGKSIYFVNVSAFQIRMTIKVKHKNKKRWDFPLGNRPTSCRSVVLRSCGRSSALPHYPTRCKGKHFERHLEMFLTFANKRTEHKKREGQTFAACPSRQRYNIYNLTHQQYGRDWLQSIIQFKDCYEVSLTLKRE